MKRKKILLLCKGLLPLAALVIGGSAEAQVTSGPVQLAVTNPPSLALVPTVASVQPPSIVKTANAIALVISGSNFNAGTVVNLLLPESTIPLTLVPTAWTASTLTVTIPAGTLKLDGQMFLTVTNPPVFAPPCVASVAVTWANKTIAPPAGNFRIEFDATPTAMNQDAVVGLSLGPATGYASVAAAVRFSNTGIIDARNGALYGSISATPYLPGTAYHFLLDVNLTAHTYSISVGGKPLGTNFAFRTEQAAVASLNNLAMFAEVGGVSLCNPVVTASSVVVPPTLHSVALRWDAQAVAGFNVYRSVVSGAAYLLLNKTPIVSPSFLDPSVTNGTTYFYVVTAVDAGANESGHSSEVPATIPN